MSKSPHSIHSTELALTTLDIEVLEAGDHRLAALPGSSKNLDNSMPIEKRILRRRISRNQHGITMLVIIVATMLILLPLGLFAFEVARMQMAQKQLRSATDSAALAAAVFLSNASGDRAANTPAAKAMALDFFKQNMVMSGFLSNTTPSSTTATDSPAVGAATLDVSVDATTGRVTANAAYGLAPAFSQYLKLGTAPIRSHSLAGYQGIEGDIVLAVDISDSMTQATKSKVAKRTYDAGADTTTYAIIRNSKAPPTLGRMGSAAAIPDPATVDFSASPIMDKFKNAPSDVKVAALVEAKRGNLETQAVFESSNANKGALKTYVTPQAGYKAGFQQVAMQAVEPLNSAKVALRDFVAQLTGSDDAHLSLITFGGRESTGQDAKDDFSTFSGHKYPHVNLNKQDSKRQLVVDSIGPSLTFNGTDTKGAMRGAIDMLEGPEHRPEVEKTIILLTDGIPTTGSPKPLAKEAGEKGIRLFAIGFFQTPYAMAGGPKTLKNMVAACGNGSKMYLAPDLPTLQDVLAQISQGTLALINDD